MLTVSQTVVKAVRRDTGLAYIGQTPQEEQTGAHLADVSVGAFVPFEP